MYCKVYQKNIFINIAVGRKKAKTVIVIGTMFINVCKQQIYKWHILETDKSENIQTLTTDRFDMKICLRENFELQTLKYTTYLFLDLTVDKMLQCFCNLKANRSIK
jgi:hypothetical protein